MSNSRRSTKLSLALIGLALCFGGRTLADEQAAKAAPTQAPPAAAPASAAKPAEIAKPVDKPNDSMDLKITLKWSTASEVDNYGYFVFRGEDEKGPFKALNERAIPGAGNSEVPRDYRYEDHTVTLGKTYFYYLESVSTVGTKEKFSPILKRECCKLPGAKEEPKGDKKGDKKEKTGPVLATPEVPAVAPKKSR